MSGTVPAPPPKDPRQRRYTMKTVQQAREMYGDGDSWTVGQIASYLNDQGVSVAVNTVRGWVDPRFAEDMRRLNRETSRRRRDNLPRRRQPASKTPLLDRMNALQNTGLSFTGISKVVLLDLGVAMSADQVRYYLATQREPRIPKRKAGVGA